VAILFTSDTSRISSFFSLAPRSTYTNIVFEISDSSPRIYGNISIIVLNSVCNRIILIQQVCWQIRRHKITQYSEPGYCWMQARQLGSRISPWAPCNPRGFFYTGK
jgi:hypothetical protein